MKVEKTTTIDEYLLQQEEPVRSRLKQIREIIAKTVPEAKEAVSYRMPLFKYHGMLAYFAAFTNHYAIFVPPEVLNVFKSRLGEYKLSKSGIRIPNNKPVPVRLLKEIIKYTAEENLIKAEMKKAAGKKK